MTKILIVEDNPDIRLNLMEYLESKGFLTDNTDDGLKALALASINLYDFIIMDWMLPGLDGLSVCRELRKRGSETPVLVLSARDMVDDRIEGLLSGADDYLVKPFSLAELSLRIEAILRRTRGETVRTLQVGDLVMDFSQMSVTRGGVPVKLNPTAFKILKLLMLKSPGVVSRETIESEVWGEDLPDSDSLRTHLHSLRAAIDKPFGTQMLKTVTGFGWTLEPDGEEKK